MRILYTDNFKRFSLNGVSLWYFWWPVYRYFPFLSELYNRVTIKIDLHQAENISSNMEEEIQKVRKKFIKADYPRPFFNSVISQCDNKTKEQQIYNDDDYITLQYLFEDEKPFTLLKLPFCEKMN